MLCKGLIFTEDREVFFQLCVPQSWDLETYKYNSLLKLWKKRIYSTKKKKTKQIQNYGK